jgi:tetratricopeptide (TPR) repeat protein
LAAAYIGRGAAYHYKGDYNRAIADYDQAIQLRPDLAEAYYYRGKAYAKKGEKEKAIADFHKVLELSDDPNWRQQAEEQLKALGAR